MKPIQEIRKKLAADDYEFAIPHFFEEMANDDLEFPDIENAIQRGDVRQKFSHDPRGTRYEVVGPALDDRSIAVICRIKNTGKLLFITTYALED